MPVEERRRIALHHQIAAAWGEEAADTLFDLMTPAGQDPATHQDVLGLRDQMERDAERIDARFTALEERLEARLAALGERFERRIGDAVTTQTRTLVLSQLAALVAVVGLAFGLR